MGTNNNTEAGGGEGGGASVSSSPIQSFFNGSTVLVTGATGFVGKALVEKLLRSCQDLKTVYLLIRPKRGLDVQERHKELLKNPVFDRIRSECPGVFNKIVSVEGDVSEENLGLSAEDRMRLVTEVNVVFHSAATVRFNESLKSAVTLNTVGTQRVIALCRDIHNLQAFVHVSTAYSNADKSEVLEIVYPPPADPERVIQLTAAWREPVPGWVDNVCGITGIMMEIGRGTIRSIICDQNLTMDLIPVDFVVNTLIGVAWHTATYRPNTVRVYNCTSGSVNPISWQDFGILTQRHACTNPTRYVMWYPGFTFRTNRIVHKICESLFHFLPAFVADLLLRLQGATPIMMKISKKFQLAAKTGEFFSLHEWKFHRDNVSALIRDAQDKSVFNVDVSQMEWDTYVKYYMLGIRKYVLKDSSDTIPSARRKLQKLYWVHRITQVLTVVFLLKIARLR
ncbi:putative fatty acyl-CoA reductase [Blattella germanica]|nr:putative fatty acyl-CoA reductase [Blattella germanica]